MCLNKRIVPCIAMVGALLSIFTGCGGGDAPATADAGAAQGANASQQTAADAASQAAGSGTQAESASQATVVENGVDTAAAQSVALFLDSLRRGDEVAANSMLTTKAREELAKTPYAMQPLGTPEGKYEIGRVGFPYEDKSVALVESVWTEPSAEGQEPVQMEIVCEVCQEEAGWRISGMGVTMVGSEEALVIDFEDAASLQNTIDQAKGEPTENQQDRVAGQTADPVTSGTGQSGGNSNLPPIGNQSGAQQPVRTASGAQPDYPPLPSSPNNSIQR